MTSACKFKVCDKKKKIWLSVGALTVFVGISAAPIYSVFALVPSVFLGSKAQNSALVAALGSNVFKLQLKSQDWQIENLNRKLTESEIQRWHFQHPNSEGFHATVSYSVSVSSKNDPVQKLDSEAKGSKRNNFDIERLSKDLESSGMQVLRAQEALNPQQMRFVFFDLKPTKGSEAFLRQNLFKIGSRWVTLTCVGQKKDLTRHLELCRQLVESVGAL